jgi:exodeoxyribonuclease VII small subunit
MADKPSFSQDLERLEAIVRRLEGGDLDLDEALMLFEEGVERLRGAKTRLAAAEAKVKQVLTDRSGALKIDDLDG